MKNRFYEQGPLSLSTVKKALQEWLMDYPKELRKVLIIPPDGTRAHSFAGPITNILYHLLQPAVVRILPALGTHTPMTAAEKKRMFGEDIPQDVYLDHNWRTDVQLLGVVPKDFVLQVSGGLLDYSIAVEINKEILQGGYDLILSVGQVLPHEVSGMANYTKNIVVGCGGKEIIDKTHFLGAVYGMEKMMGKDRTPVRMVFDYTEEHLLSNLPLGYILTVTTTHGDRTNLEGLFLGREREVFTRAVASSQKHNLNVLRNPLQKVVAYLNPSEFKSTWLGNKAIYRTRMAIADGGELIVLAPGVHSFGEDADIDKLIRIYGYKDRNAILQFVEQNSDLRRNLSAAAHLIHGSSDGRFQISYAVEHLTREEVVGVNYNYLSYAEARRLYNHEHMPDGYQVVGGEEVFFINNPALGLWVLEQDFPAAGRLGAEKNS